MPRKSVLERCKSTYKSMKARAKKDGAIVEFVATDLEALVLDQELCQWCRRKLTPAIINFDHETPLARGGSWELSNIRPICASCNRRKGTLDSNEYNRLLLKLRELSEELGSDYVARNVLARMAAGAAFIYR